MTTDAVAIAGAQPTDEPENLPREVFIFVLSVLSIVNFVLVMPFSPLTSAQREVIAIIDAILTLFFLIDVALRMRAAPSARRYLLHDRGWLDLLGSLPGLRLLRLFRVVRAGTLMREYGLGNMIGSLIRNRAQSALYLVTLLVILILEISGTLVLRFEVGAPGANITTGGDALWWGLVTATTVGYGDEYPITTGGRITGAFLLLSGVVVFATLSGYLANAFLSPSQDEGLGAGQPEPEAVEPTAAAVPEMLALLRQQQTDIADLRARLDEALGSAR